ncbi:Aste57867_2115 [Aphanomyces stellatus]|uniref:TBC1 domain family member 31 n=1 Tax=Aphanomyces stellatus TaxID=120398 RepID=A0A485KBY3_9STRA|nr:hypothetical protein As57867_002110 [Aphanomyces stellatus]VFT79318.1 Aste57867_2115 [Aphanomyces stellatus]
MVYEVRLKLGTDEEGVLWPRRPQVGPSGLLGCMRNLPLRAYKNANPDIPLSSNAGTFGNARFRCVAFSVGGDIFAAVDEKGRVFAFFPQRNRYSLVCHLGTPALECAFSPQQRTELLVTCEDLTVRCVNVQTKTLVSSLRGHRQIPTCVSFQRPGQLALTASADAVIMWDSANWSRFRTLNAGPGVEAAQFVGNGELVAVCFRDDSILMWELSTLALQYRFTLPEYEHPPGLKRFCVSENCQVIVASGQSPFIYVWEFESQTLIRIIELPATVQRIVQHTFVPGTSNILGVLGDDGQLNFLNVTSKQPKVSLQIAHKVKAMTSFDIDCHGKYLAACSSDGCLILYDLDIARETAYAIQDIRQRADAEDLAYLPHRSALESQHSALIDTLFGTPLASHEAPPHPHPAAHGDDALPQRSTSSAPATKPNKKSSTISLNKQEYAVQHNRLQQLLRSYGRFPERYRLLAWTFLLQLPDNTPSLEQLFAKGDHPATTRLHEAYPIQNQRLFRRLKRILSALAFWCPVYGEVASVPALVFPFVKVCANNDAVAFEVVLSVLLHWGRDFVLQYPYPPRPQLARLDHVLQERDPQLHAHFTSHCIPPEEYGWSLVSTAFTEVLGRDDWLCLWDNLFAYWDKPSLLWSAVLAFLVQVRGTLLHASSASAIHATFHQQQPLQTKHFIAEMHSIRLPPLPSVHDKNDDDDSAAVYFPLPPGQYPVFKRYPAFVVDYQIQERNRIAADEAALESKRTLLARIETRTRELEVAHQKWMDDKAQVLQAEHRRRVDMMRAEKARLMEMNILHVQTRERRLKQIERMEATAREALEETTKVLQAEHARWMDELNVHTEKEKFRGQQLVDDEEITRLEVEAQRRVATLTQDREREERLQAMRLEFFAQLREQEIRDQMVFDGWKEEDREALQAHAEATQDLLAKQQRREEAKLRREWKTKFNEQRLQKQRQLQLLAQERAMRPTPHVQDKYDEIDNDDDEDGDASDTETTKSRQPSAATWAKPEATVAETTKPKSPPVEVSRPPRPSPVRASAPLISTAPWRRRPSKGHDADDSDVPPLVPDPLLLASSPSVASSGQRHAREVLKPKQWSDHELLQRALDNISSSDDDDGDKAANTVSRPESTHMSQLEQALRAEFSDLSGSERESLEQRPLSELERDLEDLLGDESTDDEDKVGGEDGASQAPSFGSADLKTLLGQVNQPPLVVQASAPPRRRTSTRTPSPLTTNNTPRRNSRSETTEKLMQLRSKLTDLEALANKAAMPPPVEVKNMDTAEADQGEHDKLMERAKELLEQHAARLRD